MIFFSFLFGSSNSDVVDVVDVILDKIRNVEHVVKSNWSSWWDRVYMQEVRANGAHPKMEVFKSTVSKNEIAVLHNDDDSFTVICRLGYDHSNMELDEALVRIQEVVDGNNKAVEEAA